MVVARRASRPRWSGALDDAGIAVDDIAMHRPSLDDVFFALTGRRPNRARMPADDAANELVEV